MYFSQQTHIQDPILDSRNPPLLRGLCGLAQKMSLSVREAEYGQDWGGRLSFDLGMALNLCVVLGFSFFPSCSVCSQCAKKKSADLVEEDTRGILDTDACLSGIRSFIRLALLPSIF